MERHIVQYKHNLVIKCTGDYYSYQNVLLATLWDWGKLSRKVRDFDTGEAKLGVLIIGRDIGGGTWRSTWLFALYLTLLIAVWIVILKFAFS